MLVAEVPNFWVDAPTDQPRGDLKERRVADKCHLFNILVMAANEPEM